MYERSRHQTNYQDVGDFHKKFGLDTSDEYLGEPRLFNPELMRFRIQFLLEELLEFVEGAGMVLDYNQDEEKFEVREDGSKKPDHAQMFDALIDLVYVAMGTSHFNGYPWQAGWDMVQRANMNKVRAKDASDSKRGSAFDVVKPAGWTPPDIEALLRKHGWAPSPTYGHRRDGLECTFEVCGGGRFDPCNYSPDTIRELEDLADWENDQ